MFILLLIVIAVLVFGFVFFKLSFRNNGKIIYGVTFSQIFAEELGLDWQKTYLAALDELNIKNIRLATYWNKIEKNQGDYDFSDVDWQIAEAAKRDAKIILTIGQRTPRWPECFIPDWANNFTKEQREQAVLSYLKTMVNRYKDRLNIIAWQVENEPLLSLFGECPETDFAFYKKEVTLVKSLDARPVMTTDSGELSLWLRTAQVADILGTSIYRSTYNNWWGYFYYPYPPAFYQWHARVIKFFYPHLKKVIVSEFQFEPWARIDMVDLDINEQYKSFDLKRFENSLKFIKRSGFDEVYLWGVEWWYWLKEEKGISDFWEKAREIWENP